MKAPTDIEILNTIYNTYYATFKNFLDWEKKKTRATKVYVPVNFDEIGKKLGVDGDIIFGRLYYYLSEKYSYVQTDGTKVKLFTLKAGKDINCVQFPLMASVLAKLRDERKRYLTSTGIAFFSLLVAIAAVLIAAL